MSRKRLPSFIHILCVATIIIIHSSIQAQTPSGTSTESAKVETPSAAPQASGEVKTSSEQSAENLAMKLLPGKKDWRGRISLWGDLLAGGSIDANSVGQAVLETNLYTGFDLLNQCNVSSSFVCVKFHPFIGLGLGRYIDSKAGYFHFLTGGGVRVFLGRSRSFAIASQLGVGVKASGIDSPTVQLGPNRVQNDYLKNPNDRTMLVGAFELGGELDLGALAKTEASRGINLRFGLKVENAPSSYNNALSVGTGLATDIGGYVGIRYQLPN